MNAELDLKREEIVKRASSLLDENKNSGLQSRVDNNLVTSPHYKYVGDWMKETINLLKSKKV